MTVICHNTHPSSVITLQSLPEEWSGTDVCDSASLCRGPQDERRPRSERMERAGTEIVQEPSFLSALLHTCIAFLSTGEEMGVSVFMCVPFLNV